MDKMIFLWMMDQHEPNEHNWQLTRTGRILQHHPSCLPRLSSSEDQTCLGMEIPAVLGNDGNPPISVGQVVQSEV